MISSNAYFYSLERILQQIPRSIFFNNVPKLNISAVGDPSGLSFMIDSFNSGAISPRNIELFACSSFFLYSCLSK